MPRWAFRIALEVVSVRVERVQEISFQDCMAEGCPKKYAILGTPSQPTPHAWFEDLWDSINGKKPGRSWADNPYVWAVEFKRA